MAGDQMLQVPRDRNSTFQSPWLEAHQPSTNELQDEMIALYAKGSTMRDIQNTLHEIYGVELLTATITAVMDKVWGLVEAWQNRPLAAIYPGVYLDAIHLKFRRDGRVQNTAVYVVLGVDLDYLHITVRAGKGAKDRRTILPQALVGPLEEQLTHSYLLHQQDLAEMFLERGFVFKHETACDWETRFAMLLAKHLRRKRRGTAGTWTNPMSA